jgi:DME family drug/metabolite transporter
VTTRSRPSPTTRAGAVLAVLGASALFGTTGTAQALGPADATPLGIGAVRLAVGAATLAAIAAARGTAAHRDWRRHAPALLVGGAAVAAYHLAWFAGLRRTGVALGTIVGIGSGPVFAGLLHVALARGRLARAWIAGTALTIAGTALLAAPRSGGASADPVGVALVLAAGLGYAAYAQAAKHALDRGLDAPAAMAGIFGVSGALLAPLLALEPLGWLATLRGTAMALHLGVLTVGLAYTLYGLGLRRLAVPTVVTLTLAEPVTAALLGVALVGERLGPVAWLGAAVVAAGLVVAGRGEASEGPRETPPQR